MLIDQELNLRIKNQKAQINEHLDSVSYNTSDLTWKGRVLETFGIEGLNMLKAKIPSGTILDMGASAGLTTKELAAYFGENVKTIGVEINAIFLTGKSPRLQHFLKMRQNRFQEIPLENEIREPLLIQADGYFPPFPYGCFDAIFAMNNIFHLIESGKMNLAAVTKIFESWLKILKPRGLLCVSGTIGNEAYIIFELSVEGRMTVFAKKDLIEKYGEHNSAVQVFGVLKMALKNLGVFNENE